MSAAARAVSEERRRSLLWTVPLVVGVAVVGVRVVLELAAPESVTAAQPWIYVMLTVTGMTDVIVYRLTDMRRQGLMPEDRRRLRSPFLTAAPFTLTVVILMIAAWLYS